MTKTMQSEDTHRHLERYELLLSDARKDLQKKFDGSELSLLADCWNGTWFEPADSIRHISVEVADGIELDGLAAKWEVDPIRLVEKIIALSMLEKIALVDAVERFWQRSHDNNHLNPANILDDAEAT
jgi:hypothetical protein